MAASPRKRKPKKAPLRDFWSEGRFAVEGLLPFPAVDYWQPYAEFLGFAESVDGPFRLCECARSALVNALVIERRYQVWRGETGRGYSPPDARFPTWAAHAPFDELPDDPEAATLAFRFGEKLCHRCNMVTPSRSYCAPMYGGSFKQSYGWYIGLNLYRFGVKPTSLRWLPDVVPPELEELLAGFPTDRDLSFEEVSSPAARSVERFAENATRQEFGVNPVGEGWVSESLLAKLVGEILPDQELVRHLRPDWLEGLELDIWLPGLKTGVEYQGQQHFHAIKAWGGEEALDKVRTRDARKALLCEQLGVRLITVDYTEPLTRQHIRDTLTLAGLDLPPAE